MNTVLLAPLLAIALPCAASAGPSADASGLADTRAIHSSATNTWKIDRKSPGATESIAPSSRALDPPLAGVRATCLWDFAPNVPAHPPINGQALWPDIAVTADGSKVGVVWMDDHSSSYHVYYAQSTDDGATWSAPETVDTRVGGNLSRFPDLEFTPSGTPVVVWEDDRAGSGGMNVYTSRRTGGLPPWSPNVKVNDTGGPPTIYDFMNASLAVLNDTSFFVAWTDWREGTFYQVYMRSTTDAGATWSAAVRVSDELGYQPVAGDPNLALDASSSPSSPALVCLTNDWRGNVPGGRYPNVFAYRSTDGGASWSTGVQVNDVDTAYQQVTGHSIVILRDGTRTAGWFNSPAPGDAHLNVNVSTDGGATWSASAPVDLAGTGTYPSIATNGTWVFAAFDAYQADWDAYFRASSDGGRTWSEGPCRVDDDVTGAASENAVVAVGPTSKAYVTWMDGRPGAGSWKTYTTSGTSEATSVGNPLPAVSPSAALRCSPNPSLAGSSVRVSLPRGNGLVRIFDASGRLVRELPTVNGEAQWDGRDRFGREAAPGAYFLRVREDPRLRGDLVRLR